MDAPTFLARVAAYRDAGWRLSVVNATSILPGEELAEGAFDVTWSFARGGDFETIRERIVPGDQVPSISKIFGGAFLYENEMRELFGIDVDGIAVDLRGELYKTATRVPFSPSAIRARLEASGRSAAPPKHEAPRKLAPAAPATPPAEPPAPAAPAAEAPAPQTPEPATAAARPSESATPPSTRASGHETSVSEGAEEATKLSPAPQTPVEDSHS